MKKQFLIAYAFIFAVTSSVVHATPPVTSNPTMSRVYGNQYTPEVPVTQDAGDVGVLDNTFGTNGSMSIDAVLSGSTGQVVQTLPNGDVAVVVSKAAADSYLALYDAQGAYVSGFNSGAPQDLGAATLNALAMMVDNQGRYVIAGGAASGTAGWLLRVAAAGGAPQVFSTGTAWQYIGGVAQQTSGKIIAVGFNGTNAMIARYTAGSAAAAGAIDTTFGTSGYTVLDGSGTNLPTVGSQGLVSVFVDGSDNIYVAFVATATAHSFTSGNAYIARFTANGALDTTWNGVGFAALSALNTATAGLYLAQSANSNIIVGGRVGVNVKVTGVTSFGASIGGFATFNTSSISGDTFVINNLITDSTDHIYVVGSDATSINMAVIKLLSTGLLDNTTNDASGAFNTTGYNFFNISSPGTASQIKSVAIAPDGQLYTTGYQVNAAITTPYLSRLYNNQYVSQVQQYPNATQEQGILDLTFGDSAIETYTGVTTPFNGLYGPSMMQRATAACEAIYAGSIPTGDIVVGMNGFTNDSAIQNMMFAFLTPDGDVDTSDTGGVSIPASGYLTLANASSGDSEYITSMLQDGNGNIYVSGYASSSTTPVAPGDSTITQAFVRSYSDFTSGDEAYSSAVVATGYQGLGLGYQGFSDTDENRVLLCVGYVVDDEFPLTLGAIYGYNASSGDLDLTFGDATTPGSISTTSYGLNMGSCYGLVTATSATEPFIFAAYVDSFSNEVTIVKFQENGNGLIIEFGSSGVVANLFPSASVAANNVRIGLLSNDSLLVVAATATELLAVVVDSTTGDVSSVMTQTIDGAASLNLSRVTGVSDGTAIVTMSGTTAAPDDIMYLARLNSLGGTLAPALDTTFNSQGGQPGVQSIQIGNQVSDYDARVASYALVQSTPATGNQGNIAVIGYESVTANDATPMVMRSYGALGTTEVIDYPISVVEPGTFDFAEDLQSLLGTGFGNVIFTYPSGNAHAGYLLVGIDNGTTTKIARIDAALTSLDGSFGSSGIYTVSPNLRGVSHISIDNNNNILVGGTDTGAGWAQVILDDGSAATAFNMTGLGIAGVNNILQQQSGRYIVAGTKTGTSAGMVVAFQDKLVGSATMLAIDPTFNPLSYGSAPYAGSFELSNSDGLYAMAIQTANHASSPTCQLDMIAIAYNSAGTAYVAQITADGNGYVFGPTSTTMSVDNSASVQLNIDANQNIVVACSYNSGATHQLTARRYDCAGGTTTAFYGAGVSGGIQTLPFTGSTSVTLTGVMETTLSQTVLTGYNVVAGSGTVANGPLFAARLVANGALDTVWNTSPVGSDYAGLLTYGSGTTSAQLNVNSACIANSGNVYSIGSSNAVVGSSDPIVSVVYGTTSVTQVSQNPLEVAAGIIDTTLPNAYTGAAALGGVVTGVPQKIYEYNSSVNSSPNGAMLVASVAATRYAYITQLNADLTVNTANFGTSGVVTLDLGAGNVVTITDLYVGNGSNTAEQSIYVAGYTTNSGTNTMFAARVLADGSDYILAPASSLVATTAPSSGGIRQSTNGRVLVSGYNGSAGVVVAYNAAMDAIDTSFGNNSNSSPYYGGGYYVSSTDNPIVAMTTDNTDRLYIAYQVNATTINIDRVLENGTGLDTTWNSTGTVTLSGTALSQLQIKLAIDLVNNQLVVAAQDGAGASNIIQLARFNLSNGSAAGTLSTVTISGDTLQLADLFIDNDAAAAYPFTSGAYPNIYVVGYVSASTGADAGHAIVARVASTSTTMTLDTSYGTGGIANLAAGSMSVVTAGMLDLDRRVYLVGSNGGSTSYMARVFGDYYWQESSNTIAQAAIGSVDNTLVPGYPGVAGADLSVASVTSSAWNTAFANNAYTAYAVIENPNGDGSCYVAFGNGTNLIVGQMNADLKPNPLFGLSVNGLTNTVVMATINSIAIDAAGNIIVAGANGGAQKVVSYTSAGVLNATFATTIASNVGTTVAQQKSGRYIVGGYNGTTGLVTAFKNESAISSATLPVDATFGPAGNNGYFATGINAPIDDLVIDSNDYIYIVYRNGGAVNVAKLTPEGCLSNISTFGAGTNTPSGQSWAANPITASSTPVILIDATQPARIAINSAGNILVGASVGGGIKTQLINASTGALIGSTLSQGLSNTPVLTKLVGAGATSGSGAGTEFYGTFYNSLPLGYVFAVDNTGILDTSFGPYVTGSSGPQTGLLQLTGQTPLSIKGLSVQADGKLVAVGRNSAGTSSTAQPILMRAYGYEYVAQFAQAPDQIGAGQLDTTIWPTTGVFALDNLQIGGSVASAFNTAIAGYAVKRVYEYSTNSTPGVMLFVADDDTAGNTIIFQLKKDLSLDSSFGPYVSGSSGPQIGYITLSTNYGGTTGLFVDSLGNIFVVGNDGDGNVWAQGFTSAGGSLSPAFEVSGSAINATQILQQSNGRIIISGTNGGAPALYGYMSSGAHSGELDPSFGYGGSVNGGGFFTISDIAIDAYDNIIAVGNGGGNHAQIYKFDAYGLNSTNIGAHGTLISGVVGNPKVVLDNNGNIVVAAATSSGYALRSYVNNNTYPTSGTQPGTNIGSASFTAGTTPVLGNIYATTDNKITLVGYDSATTGTTAYDAIAARLVSGPASLILDTTTFNVALTGAGTPQAGVLIASLGGAVGMNQVFDGIIHADDRIMLVGSNVSTPAPLMGRVFGDVYASYISQAGHAQGVAGTLNTTFGDTHPPTGAYNLATLDSVLGNGQGKALLGLADGGFYMALDNADSGTSSILIKTLADGSLDTSYNNGGGTAIAGIAGGDTDTPNYAPLGVQNILQDGSGNVVLVGTTGGAGWVQRYTSAGVLDTGFNGTGIITMAASTSANAVVEQTLARLVVAGSNGSGAALFAYESLAPNGTPGTVDTTFNAGAGGTPGYLQVNTTAGSKIYNLVADQYDRLIFGVFNSGTSAVDLYRLTPTGELDVTFGTGGIKLSALSSITDASSVRVAIDAAGNIIVAASDSGSDIFSVRAFNNGTSTSSGGNGAPVYAQLNISSLTNSPAVTSLICSADGYALVGGIQAAGTDNAWIARITAGGALDTAGFNPAGSPAGIFQYSGSGDVAHVYNALAIKADGTIGMFGYETSTGSVYVPNLVSVYDDPYTTQEPISPDSQPVGSIDLTLGWGSASNGIIYYGGGSAYTQTAKAVALYDDNNIVVAIDGANGTSSNSSVFLNMFDTDGIANPNFGTSGSATVLQGSDSPVSPDFQNQYVSDMVTYTTLAGVHKAIVAGYTYNSVLPLANQNSSLLFQYTLAPGGTSQLDTSFGGYNGSPAGIAFGDAKKAFVVGQQSTGRIIVGGLSQNNLGVLLGYTANGKLDMSFGNSGYQSSNTGSAGIYSHAIDTQNRIAITYNNGGTVEVVRFLADGSALDNSFTAEDNLVTQSGSTDMKVAVDSSNNIYAAAVTLLATAPTQISVMKYDAANGDVLDSADINWSQIGGANDSVYAIGRLIIDAAGNVIIVAYDTEYNNVLVIRLTSALELDPTFNTNGYVLYQVKADSMDVTASQVATDAIVHPDGRIIIVGSENSPMP